MPVQSYPKKPAKVRGPSLPGPPHEREDASVRLLVPHEKPRPAFTMFHEVVIPVEGTDREYLAQQYAAELAAALGIRIRGLHVSPGGSRGRQDVFRYLEGECRRWNVPFEGTVIEGGDPVEEIAQEVQANDLLLVGTRRLATSELLGSIARELVKRVSCAVVLIRLPA